MSFGLTKQMLQSKSGRMDGVGLSLSDKWADLGILTRSAKSLTTALTLSSSELDECDINDWEEEEEAAVERVSRVSWLKPESAWDMTSAMDSADSDGAMSALLVPGRLCRL